MTSSGGSSNDDTLLDDAGPPSRSSAPRLSLSKYELGATIGEGGMGEVLLARDPNIGRDVAIKRVRTADASPEVVERFLREAKIQARLDHPAIVPVYDLGRDREGQPYFTMKRLSGTTLIARLAAGNASQQSLLRAFVDVCLAIDFAHARGVVHRDLKPANIMLGDYGEVYVLDWGIARIVERVDNLTPAAGSPSISPDGHTQAGALLGTPGYMAPEQASGHEVGPAADVYALGAILFEILAGEQLHARGATAIANTIATPQQSPAQRRPERAIAPELDTACTEALAGEPHARPTARALGERIQRYLDGDRDLERRRALAHEHLASAREAANDPLRRADAIRDAGRALALDPESAEAATLVMTFMLEPPKELPEPLARELENSDNETGLKSARNASRALTAGFLLLPFVLWAGVANAWMVVAMFGVIGVLALDAHLQVRRNKTRDTVPLLLSAIPIGLVGQVLSPFVLLPMIIIGFIVGLGGQPKLIDRRKLIFTAGFAMFVLPLALEMFGVLPRTWELEHGKLVITSSMLKLDSRGIGALLVAAHVVIIAVICIFLHAVTASRRNDRRAIEIQAWQLRQMLPAPPPSDELAALVAADCREDER